MLGQGNNRRLGSAIGGAHHIAHAAGIRRRVDNRAATGLDHMGNGVLAAEQERSDIHVERCIPDLNGDIHYRGVLGLNRQGCDRHIVMENIDGAEGGNRALNQVFDGICIGGIVANGNGIGSDFVGQRFGSIDIEIADDHFGTLGSVADSTGCADSSGATGDDGDFIGKTWHGVTPVYGLFKVKSRMRKLITLLMVFKPEYINNQGAWL